MVQPPRRVGMALGAWLVLGLGLAGCSSESSFRPWQHNDDEDTSSGQDDPDGPDPGGWGDWELGEIPSLAVVMSTWTTDGSGGGTELVVVDLRGQILDTWQPPIDESYGWYPMVTQVEPLGTGKVLVVTSLGWDRFDQSSMGSNSRKSGEIPDKLYGGWGGGEWQAGWSVSGVWIGDLTTRTWTRVLHQDWLSNELIVEQTGQRVPLDQAWSAWSLRVAPHAQHTDRALLAWTPYACGRDTQQRVFSVPLTESAEGRLWLLERDWPEVPEPFIRNLYGGANADGEATTLSMLGPHPCVPYESPVPHRLVRWRLGGGPQVLADDLLYTDAVAFDPTQGGAMVVSMPTDEVPWGIRWLGAPGGTDLLVEDVGGVRPIAALDTAHGAALVHVVAASGQEELVMVAGGRDVWHIDELKQGLSKRPIQMLAGTVVEIPE